jgi:DNA-binding IclR family transcriptional regulator
VSFYVRDEAVRVCLHRVDSTHAVRYHVREGDVLPLESGSGGLALLAFGGAEGEAVRADSRRLLLRLDGRTRSRDGRHVDARLRRAPDRCAAC